MKPPRLSSLRIERFRQIKQLTIPEIGHVNLIVGGNNSGKSTLLDALRFFAAKADPEVLLAMLSEHGEFEHDFSEDEISWRSLSHLFFDRKFPDQDQENIYVGNQDKNDYVSLEHIYLVEEFVELPDEEGSGKSRRLTKRLKNSENSFLDSTLDDLVEAIEITVLESKKIKGKDLSPRVVRMPLERFFGGYKNIRIMKLQQEFSTGQSYSFVPSRFRSAHELVEVWDSVVLTPYEQLALDALRIIDPDVVDLAFVKNGQQRRRPSELRRYEAEERIAVIKVKNKERRIPLLSMGDGMSRVLQLMLSASQAQDGMLLIDEIENGLHYSVQEKVWGMLFKLAEDNNIQIFATTHSEDCVKTFAKVSTERQNVKGCLIRLGRSPDGKTEAAVLNEDQVQNLVQAEIELR
jgi:AAA15 family ATPase/GTPase